MERLYYIHTPHAFSHWIFKHKPRLAGIPSRAHQFLHWMCALSPAFTADDAAVCSCHCSRRMPRLSSPTEAIRVQQCLLTASALLFALGRCPIKARRLLLPPSGNSASSFQNAPQKKKQLAKNPDGPPTQSRTVTLRLS